MDPNRFDALSRSLVSLYSRRGVGVSLGRAAIGTVLASLLTMSAASAKKKRGKRKKKPQFAQTPPPPGCQRQCGGKDCGPDGCGRSCGSCLGGTCTAGLCACPDGTDLCGGACLMACSGFRARDPMNCGCCSPPSWGCSGDGSICCSGTCTGPSGQEVCGGRLDGESCAFSAVCSSGSCRNRVCTSVGACSLTADYCTDGTSTCGTGGFCLRPRGGGRSVCGVQPNGDQCGCANDAQCAKFGPGAFCARDTGGSCSCPSTAQSFCAVPR